MGPSLHCIVPSWWNRISLTHSSTSHTRLTKNRPQGTQVGRRSCHCRCFWCHRWRHCRSQNSILILGGPRCAVFAPKLTLIALEHWPGQVQESPSTLWWCHPSDSRRQGWRSLAPAWSLPEACGPASWCSTGHKSHRCLCRHPRTRSREGRGYSVPSPALASRSSTRMCKNSLSTLRRKVVRCRVCYWSAPWGAPMILLFWARSLSNFLRKSAQGEKGYLQPVE